MEKRIVKKELVTLDELKQNLRLTDTDAFSTDLQSKLSAALRAAGSYIGRDLGQVEQFSYIMEPVVEIDIDPAKHVTAVKVEGLALPPEQWSYAGGYLSIYGHSPSAAAVTVELEYNEDIAQAVLMHASSMWMNPTDTVETLPKASTNLLRQYRRYNAEH